MSERREDFQNKRKKLTKEEQIKRKRLIEARKKKKRKRIIASIFGLIAVFIIVAIVYMYSFVTGLKTNTLGEGIKPASSKSPINILVLGLDVGDTDQMENKSIRRSDTIMLFNYNPNTKKVHLISIPRDTLIEVDAYLDNGEYQRYWKINAAYALGGEEEITKHVEELLNVSINYIVEIDYKAFRSIVDAIGGVEMYIDQDMFYDDNAQDLHINFKAGETVLLDGKKAEEFFRWRKNNDGSGGEEGDLGRIKNQQLFINKLLKKALTPSVIFKIPGILEAISENVDTNIPANELISLGLNVLKLNAEDVIMATLQGAPETIYGQDYLIAYKDLNRELINSLKTDNIENSMSNIKRDTFNLLVLNGTQIEGLASTEKSRLIELGYSNITIGNGEPCISSVIQTNNKELKDILKNDTGISKFEKITNSDYEEYDAVIILGTDY